MPQLWFLVIAVAAAGSFVQAASGLGYAMVFMSVLPLWLDFRSMAVAEALSVLPINLWVVFRYRKKVRFSLILIPALCSLVTNALGVALQSSISADAFRRVVGGALVAISLFELLRRGAREGRVDLRLLGAAGGLTGGFLAGLCSIGGPPMAIYMLRAARDKEEYVASLNAYFIISVVSVVANHILRGNVTPAALRYSAFAMLGVAVGTALGMRLFRACSTASVRRIVYGVMLCMGGVLLILG